MTYMLKYWQEDGWYCGFLVEKPGVVGQERTLKKLQASIRGAYGEILAIEAERDLVLTLRQIEPHEARED